MTRVMSGGKTLFAIALLVCAPARTEEKEKAHGPGIRPLTSPVTAVAAVPEACLLHPFPDLRSLAVPKGTLRHIDLEGMLGTSYRAGISPAFRPYLEGDTLSPRLKLADDALGKLPVGDRLGISLYLRRLAGERAYLRMAAKRGDFPSGTVPLFGESNKTLVLTPEWLAEDPITPLRKKVDALLRDQVEVDRAFAWHDPASLAALWNVGGRGRLEAKDLFALPAAKWPGALKEAGATLTLAQRLLAPQLWLAKSDEEAESRLPQFSLPPSTRLQATVEEAALVCRERDELGTGASRLGDLLRALREAPAFPGMPVSLRLLLLRNRNLIERALDIVEDEGAAAALAFLRSLRVPLAVDDPSRLDLGVLDGLGREQAVRAAAEKGKHVLRVGDGFLECENEATCERLYAHAKEALKSEKLPHVWYQGTAPGRKSAEEAGVTKDWLRAARWDAWGATALVLARLSWPRDEAKIEAAVQVMNRTFGWSLTPADLRKELDACWGEDRQRACVDRLEDLRFGVELVHDHPGFRLAGPGSEAERARAETTVREDVLFVHQFSSADRKAFVDNPGFRAQFDAAVDRYLLQHAEEFGKRPSFAGQPREALHRELCKVLDGKGKSPALFPGRYLGTADAARRAALLFAYYRENGGEVPDLGALDAAVALAQAPGKGPCARSTPLVALGQLAAALKRSGMGLGEEETKGIERLSDDDAPAFFDALAYVKGNVPPLLERLRFPEGRLRLAAESRKASPAGAPFPLVLIPMPHPDHVPLRPEARRLLLDANLGLVREAMLAIAAGNAGWAKTRGELFGRFDELREPWGETLRERFCGPPENDRCGHAALLEAPAPEEVDAGLRLLHLHLLRLHRDEPFPPPGTGADPRVKLAETELRWLEAEDRPESSYWKDLAGTGSAEHVTRDLFAERDRLDGHLRLAAEPELRSTLLGHDGLLTKSLALVSQRLGFTANSGHARKALGARSATLYFTKKHAIVKQWGEGFKTWQESAGPFAGVPLELLRSGDPDAFLWSWYQAQRGKSGALRKALPEGVAAGGPYLDAFRPQVETLLKVRAPHVIAQPLAEFLVTQRQLEHFVQGPLGGVKDWPTNDWGGLLPVGQHGSKARAWYTAARELFGLQANARHLLIEIDGDDPYLQRLATQYQLDLQKVLDRPGDVRALTDSLLAKVQDDPARKARLGAYFQLFPPSHPARGPVLARYYAPNVARCVDEAAKTKGPHPDLKGLWSRLTTELIAEEWLRESVGAGREEGCAALADRLHRALERNQGESGSENRLVVDALEKRDPFEVFDNRAAKTFAEATLNDRLGALLAGGVSEKDREAELGKRLDLSPLAIFHRHVEDPLAVRVVLPWWWSGEPTWSKGPDGKWALQRWHRQPHEYKGIAKLDIGHSLVPSAGGKAATKALPLQRDLVFVRNRMLFQLAIVKNCLGELGEKERCASLVPVAGLRSHLDLTKLTDETEQRKAVWVARGLQRWIEQLDRELAALADREPADERLVGYRDLLDAELREALARLHRPDTASPLYESARTGALQQAGATAAYGFLADTGDLPPEFRDYRAFGAEAVKLVKKNGWTGRVSGEYAPLAGSPMAEILKLGAHDPSGAAKERIADWVKRNPAPKLDVLASMHAMTSSPGRSVATHPPVTGAGPLLPMDLQRLQKLPPFLLDGVLFLAHHGDRRPAGTKIDAKEAGALVENPWPGKILRALVGDPTIRGAYADYLSKVARDRLKGIDRDLPTAKGKSLHALRSERELLQALFPGAMPGKISKYGYHEGPLRAGGATGLVALLRGWDEPAVKAQREAVRLWAYRALHADLYPSGPGSPDEIAAMTPKQLDALLARKEGGSVDLTTATGFAELSAGRGSTPGRQMLLLLIAATEEGDDADTGPAALAVEGAKGGNARWSEAYRVWAFAREEQAAVKHFGFTPRKLAFEAPVDYTRLVPNTTGGIGLLSALAQLGGHGGGLSPLQRVAILEQHGEAQQRHLEHLEALAKVSASPGELREQLALALRLYTPLGLERLAHHWDPSGGGLLGSGPRSPIDGRAFIVQQLVDRKGELDENGKNALKDLAVATLLREPSTLQLLLQAEDPAWEKEIRATVLAEAARHERELERTLREEAFLRQLTAYREKQLPSKLFVSGKGQGKLDSVFLVPTSVGASRQEIDALDRELSTLGEGLASWIADPGKSSGNTKHREILETARGLFGPVLQRSPDLDVGASFRGALELARYGHSMTRPAEWDDRAPGGAGKNATFASRQGELRKALTDIAEKACRRWEEGQAPGTYEDPFGASDRKEWKARTLEASKQMAEANDRVQKLVYKDTAVKGALRDLARERELLLIREKSLGKAAVEKDRASYLARLAGAEKSADSIALALQDARDLLDEVAQSSLKEIRQIVSEKEEHDRVRTETAGKQAAPPSREAHFQSAAEELKRGELAERVAVVSRFSVFLGRELSEYCERKESARKLGRSLATQGVDEKHIAEHALYRKLSASARGLVLPLPDDFRKLVTTAYREEKSTLEERGKLLATVRGWGIEWSGGATLSFEKLRFPPGTAWSAIADTLDRLQKVLPGAPGDEESGLFSERLLDGITQRWIDAGMPDAFELGDAEHGNAIRMTGTSPNLVPEFLDREVERQAASALAKRIHDELVTLQREKIPEWARLTTTVNPFAGDASEVKFGIGADMLLIDGLLSRLAKSGARIPAIGGGESQRIPAHELAFQLRAMLENETVTSLQEMADALRRDVESRARQWMVTTAVLGGCAVGWYASAGAALAACRHLLLGYGTSASSAAMASMYGGHPYHWADGEVGHMLSGPTFVLGAGAGHGIGRVLPAYYAGIAGFVGAELSIRTGTDVVWHGEPLTPSLLWRNAIEAGKSGLPAAGADQAASGRFRTFVARALVSFGVNHFGVSPAMTVLEHKYQGFAHEEAVLKQKHGLQLRKIELEKNPEANEKEIAHVTRELAEMELAHKLGEHLVTGIPNHVIFGVQAGAHGRGHLFRHSLHDVLRGGNGHLESLLRAEGVSAARIATEIEHELRQRGIPLPAPPSPRESWVYAAGRRAWHLLAGNATAEFMGALRELRGPDLRALLTRAFPAGAHEGAEPQGEAGLLLTLYGEMLRITPQRLGRLVPRLPEGVLEYGIRADDIPIIERIAADMVREDLAAARDPQARDRLYLELLSFDRYGFASIPVETLDLARPAHRAAVAQAVDTLGLGVGNLPRFEAFARHFQARSGDTWAMLVAAFRECHPSTPELLVEWVLGGRVAPEFLLRQYPQHAGELRARIDAARFPHLALSDAELGGLRETLGTDASAVGARWLALSLLRLAPEERGAVTALLRQQLGYEPRPEQIAAVLAWMSARRARWLPEALAHHAPFALDGGAKLEGLSLFGARVVAHIHGHDGDTRAVALGRAAVARAVGAPSITAPSMADLLLTDARGRLVAVEVMARHGQLGAETLAAAVGRLRHTVLRLMDPGRRPVIPGSSLGAPEIALPVGAVLPSGYSVSPQGHLLDASGQAVRVQSAGGLSRVVRLRFLPDVEGAGRP